MRARNIKPGFFKNEDLAEIEPLGRILFAGLWCMADRAGRLEDRPKRIKAEILPYDNCNIEKLLNVLSEKKFIFRYKVEDSPYIQVINFTKHNSCHIREPESIIPAPCEHHTGTGQNQSSTVLKPLNPESPILNPESPILNPEDRPGTTGARNGFKPETLAEIWNELKPPTLPKVILPFNPGRTKKVQTAIGVRSDPEFWRTLIRSISETPFLLGGNDRGWKADFDFILKYYDGIFEGKYRTETRVSPTTIKNLQAGKEWLEEAGKNDQQ